MPSNEILVLQDKKFTFAADRKMRKRVFSTPATFAGHLMG